MRKSLAFASLVLSFAVAACSDVPTKAPDLVRSNVSVARDLAGDVDAMIVQFFPKGLETATGTRWNNIVSELGSWDAAHNTWTGTDAAQGRKHLLDLSNFIQLKTSSIEGPSLCTATILTNCETQQHAAGRLLLAMNLYVYNGPTATVPEPTPTTDLTVAIVPAGQGATVQAPSKQAGVIIPTGGTSEDRVIVVTRNEQAYPKCSGPLSAYTTLCEYPRYYRIESFPPLPLNTPGRFAVCDYLGGDNGALDRPNEVTVHERLRLAHEDPALHGGRRLGTENGARYVDNIEILPLVGVDVPGQQTNAAVCNETAWVPTHDGVLGLAQVALHSVGSAVGKMLTPKELYAYDQGVEHIAVSFSDFNSVDPESSPDLSIADVTAPSAVNTGSEMTVSYAVENRSRSDGGESTASSAATTVSAWLSTDQTIDEGDIPLGSAVVPALAPDASFPVSHTINAPSTNGTYYVLVKVAANPTITEVTLENNTSSPVPVSVRAAGGQDLVVFNDVNFFGSGGATPDPTANVSNQRMYQNLVDYFGSGARASQSGVMVHLGHGSLLNSRGGGAAYIQGFIDYYNGAGHSVTLVDNPEAGISAIPASIKLLFLVLPTSAYSTDEINTLKAFAGDGGRIVYVGEHNGVYADEISGVENPFLTGMGTNLSAVGAMLDCGLVILPASSLRASPITAGMTEVEMGCASELTIGDNDTGLITGTDGTTFISGIGPVNTTPLPALVAMRASTPTMRRDLTKPVDLLGRKSALPKR